MKTKSNGIFFAIALTLLFVTGCSKDLSSYPLIVQDGTVSPELFEKAYQFIDDYEPILNSTEIVFNAENKNEKLLSEPELIKLILEMDSLFEEKKKIDLKVRTEKDQDISQLIENIIAIQETQNLSLLQKINGVDEESIFHRMTGLAMLQAMYKQLKEEVNYPQ